MRRIAVMAAAAALLFAACGGDDDTSSSSASDGGGATLKISADPGGAKKFTETNLTAKAGKVTIEFSNRSQLPHAVEIEGNGVEKETETVTGKDAAPITVDLEPGEYTYYCPVGDHRAEGMEGTLTVE
ncbi:MAG TPA: cupredoxin domain-containing protein [Solirubrobacter sp.]|nr:cupredoxin domain-containing protein [Solirubrobacter sp.]